MTATSADAPSTPAAPPRERPQWVALTRLLASEAMTNLLWATGVMLVVIAVGSLIAWWRGWQLVVETDVDAVTVGVTGDGDGVRVVLSLFIVVLAVAIAAVVNQVVLASRTRVLVAAGATRGSVAAGLLGTLLAMVVYVLVVTAVVLLVVGQGVTGAMTVTGAEGTAELAGAAVQGAGMLALSMAVGTAIVALFLRWPWWVGTIVLTLFFLAFPWVVGLVISDVAPLTAARGWWGAELLAAALAAGVYWLIARRIPVR